MHEIKKEETIMCQAVNELFADEIAELKIKMDSELAKKMHSWMRKQLR